MEAFFCEVFSLAVSAELRHILFLYFGIYFAYLIKISVMNELRHFKIGTFNLLNLVLPGITYYQNRNYSQNDYNKKIEWIGSQLKQMGADVVGFQEVFHEEALREAVAKSEIFGEPYIVMANPTGDRPTVALASRFPIIEHEVIANFPESAMLNLEKEDSDEILSLPFKEFSRPVLKAKVRITEELDVVFFVVHLKSKRPLFNKGEGRDNPLEVAKAQARSLMLRSAESVALRALLLETMQNTQTPVVLFGDVNDGGLAVTTRIVSGEPPHRKWPLDVKLKTWDVLLYHAKDIQSRKSFSDFYYTHIHNGHYESLDHIMVSQELVAENPRSVGKVGYVSNYNDHLIDETLTNEKIMPWKSDHGQVTASIELSRKEHRNNKE